MTGLSPGFLTGQFKKALLSLCTVTLFEKPSPNSGLSSVDLKSFGGRLKNVMYAITFYKGNNTVFVTYSFSSGTYLFEPFSLAGLVTSVPEFK